MERSGSWRTDRIYRNIYAHLNEEASKHMCLFHLQRHVSIAYLVVRGWPIVGRRCNEFKNYAAGRSESLGAHEAENQRTFLCYSSLQGKYTADMFTMTIPRVSRQNENVHTFTIKRHDILIWIYIRADSPTAFIQRDAFNNRYDNFVLNLSDFAIV